jgi:uncharacterized protein (TIGR02285 family)
MRALLGSLLLIAASATQAASPVLIAYRDKPPLNSTENGKPVGLLIDKTRAIFKRAGLVIYFEEMPSKRIALELQKNTRPICSPGWYKLPEREVFANFSHAFHRDRPQIVLASGSSAAAVSAHRSIEALTADSRLQLAVVDEISYGQDLDARIKRMQRAPLRATVTALQLSKMVAAQRADYMFMDQDDLEYLDRNGEISGSGLKPIQFTDMPPGLFRHLWCSKRVDAAMLNRINAAIDQLGFDTSH